MKKKPSFKSRFMLWGFIIGLTYAVMGEIGLLTIWRPIGKPPSDIINIIGADYQKVYVQTKSGETYSHLIYFDFSTMDQLEWEKETSKDYQLENQEHSAYFKSLPPLFRVSQIYEIRISATPESGGVAKFALSVDGNIWIWRHFSAGMAIIVLPIFPLAGMLLGLFLALIWFIIDVVLANYRKNRP